MAPTAVVCDQVAIGEHSRVLFGAVVVAEGAPVEIGSRSIVMENAVLRASVRQPAAARRQRSGRPPLDADRLQPGRWRSLRHGRTVLEPARVGAHAELRVNSVVQFRAVLPADAVVPIGWIAAGDPVEVLPASDHKRSWVQQGHTDYTRVVWGLDPAGQSILPELSRCYAALLERHRQDRVLDDDLWGQRPVAKPAALETPPGKSLVLRSREVSKFAPRLLLPRANKARAG